MINKNISKEEAQVEAKKNIKDMKEKGVQNYFMDCFSDLSKGLVKNFDTVVCMDEGTAGISLLEGKLCIAGSGILYPAADREDRLTKLAKIFIDQQIQKITGHDDCRAVALSLQQENPDRTFSMEEINGVAKKWGRDLVMKVCELGGEVEFDYFKMDQMTRDKFHNAVVAYYDLSGRFNPDRLGENVPPGFVINQKVFGEEYTRQELRIAVSIALGHHGLGEFFSVETPFIIIPVLMSTDDFGVVDSLKEEFSGNERVLVSPLVIPDR